MEKTEHWRGLQADFGRLRISSEIAKMPLDERSVDKNGGRGPCQPFVHVFQVITSVVAPDPASKGAVSPANTGQLLQPFAGHAI